MNSARHGLRGFRGGWSRRWRADAAARPLVAREPGPRRAIPRPYCLACYAPMPAFEGAIQQCARCKHLNLASDQGVFWTQEPFMLRLERLAKLAIALLIAGVIYLILTGDYGFGTGQGWVAGAPILLGAYLWETAGKITRWGPELRAWIVWTVFLVVPGLLGVGLLVGYASAGHISWGWVSSAVVPVFFAYAIRRLATAFERWRLRRILRGAGLTAP